MKNMTVRGIDPELDAQLKAVARREGKSINRLVVETLRERFSPARAKRFSAIHHDMDHLFGKWSEKEFELIQGQIDEQRKVDPELWQ